MSSGKETMWLGVGLFVLVVIILGIIFKPFGEFLLNAPVEAVQTIHHAVVSGHSTMAQKSLDGGRGCLSEKGESCDTNKDDMQEHVFSEVKKLDGLSDSYSNDPVLVSTPYTQDDHLADGSFGGGVNKRNTYTSGQTVKLNKLDKRTNKDISYNRDFSHHHSIADINSSEDSDPYSKLGSGDDFSVPYGMGKIRVVKTSHPINNKSPPPTVGHSASRTGVVRPTL